MGRRRLWHGALACAVLGALALPAAAQAQGQGKRVMLYTGTTGFRHTDGINNGRPVIQQKLEALGYTVDWEDCNLLGGGTGTCDNADKNPRIFTDANLARYDAVVMLNMSWKFAGGNLPGPLLQDPQKNAIIKYVQNGGGIAAIHNATDAGAGQSIWDWWDGGNNSLVGTTMPGHAATNATGNAATVQVSDPNHLSTKDLPDTWTFMDEHYNYLRNVRGDHHVLATFDERTYNPGVNARGQDHPITYCKLYDGVNIDDGTPTRRTYRDGRSWVTGMGHFGVRYTENGGDTNLVKMIVGGVRWVAGEGKKTDCSGTVWSSFHRTVLVPDANQPIGIDVAPDGKVYWSEMGQAGVVANQYNSQGYIMMHDQKGPAGNKTIVGTILTRADHGNSEDGVLGMSLQPGFDLSDPNKRNVFVYHSPRPGPNDSWPIVATPAAQTVGYNQVSRFTLNAAGTAVVDGSERVILRVPKAKIGGSPSGFPGGPTDSGPGHVGGAGLDFDSAGNMYLGVGDDVSPNASGHSGYAPMDYRSAERWDARKTAANTADLRGKVLRITPKQGDIAAGASPGVGTTYDIPSGNLFPVGTANTRPEIYNMGFRQPFTVHTDPKNPGIIGVGEYCHDASADRADRSPAGTCEWNLINKAGNFGWPFCVGDQSPTNTMTRWNYAGNTSTGQKYDCSTDTIPSDINYAPDGQTPVAPTFQGLAQIPKPIPATIWKKYPGTTTAPNPGQQSEADFGNLTEGGMQPVSGPIYRYDGSKLGTGGFPAYYDGAWLINNRGSNTGFWKEVRLRRDNNTMLRMQDWLPYNHAGSATAQQNSLVIGTQFGSDGALYMSRYPVTCCRNNVTATSTAQIVKITFDVYEETAAPTTTVTLDPATPGVGRTYSGPVTVKFTSTDAGAADPSLPMAGVDYTEYRVILNGVPGAWQKNSNAGLSNPFLSNSVTVTDQGNYAIEYRGVDRGGNAEETKTATFTIMNPTVVDSAVQATVPSFLGLAVAPTTLGPFIPGLAQTYTGTAAATVTSSWANAQLQVYDPDTTNNGRLVNGTSVIPRNLQVMQASGTLANISNSGTPRTVATWATPVASTTANIQFSQAIQATDVLVSGQYARTLRFVLTTTTP
ncbi:ThuA domain-containing protein [Solirubrobacter soli]|uniref:ThuA domain-containing protein n=1 Tax=Solirubrobacter soli TaxID=363832 RepID=UPI00146F8F15|nr:ThuA domain-containing protein [Solirubrobacter soli]